RPGGHERRPGGHAVAAHERVRRGAGPAHPARRRGGAPHPAGDRLRVERPGGRRSARRLLLRREPDRSGRGGGAEADGRGRRAGSRWRREPDAPVEGSARRLLHDRRVLRPAACRLRRIPAPRRSLTLPRKVNANELKINRLRQRKYEAAFGDAEGYERQRAKGKLSARERIQRLVDRNSFTELDLFATHRAEGLETGSRRVAGDGVVTGFAKIDGRDC